MGQTHGVECRGEDVRENDPGKLPILPDDFISVIISFTSPLDACVAASVSKFFRMAVDTDIVWEKFLPPDYGSLVPPSLMSLSKKKLYFALCGDPVLIDDGKMSLWLDKANGKKCIILLAVNLSIIWGENPQHWQWIRIPEARFGRVAELIDVCWFKISGRMNTRVLSPGTRYSAYIVFKKEDRFSGFDDVAIEAAVGVVGQEPSRRFICFNEEMDEQFPGRKRNLVKPEERRDGWMEIELGEFFTEGEMYTDEIEITVLETKVLNWKRGLIILGIEIRPQSNAKKTG